jgi:hypothetical protein
MPRNGSGTYSLASGNPVITGTTISSTVQNNTMSDIATALTNSIAKDGQTTPTANIPLGGFKLTGVAPGTDRTDAATLANVQDGTGVYVATVGGTADVITISPSPAITAYATGQLFSFIASGANTTNVTVNVSALGAKAVTKNGSTALVAGDIPSGFLATIRYDGTRFQLVGAVAAAFNGGTVSGATTFSADVTMSGATDKWAKGADVASATALPLITDGNYFDVTGTTTITSFNSVGVGTLIALHFDGALTLTHNATDLVLPRGVNILTAAGDEAIFIEYASGDYRCISYQQAAHSMVRLNTANGYGSTNTVIRRFTNTVTNTGADITYADSATLGATFTINTGAVYAISYGDNSNVADNFGLSLNSAQLTTAIDSITVSAKLAQSTSSASTVNVFAGWTGFLAAGSVIRAHASGNAGGTADRTLFTIVRIS